MTKKVKKEVKIILLNNESNLESIANLLVVTAGYARNYLIPKKKGKLANPSDIQTITRKKNQMQVKEKLYIENCLKEKKILESSEPYILQKKTGENNKIFGKVTIKQLKQILAEKSQLNLAPYTIELPEIKRLGKFPIVICLHTKVKAFINIDIVSQ
jgi:large subunit ribosomal protein L9